MRVVNLSRKPFVNRRPVIRLTIVLWMLGAILLGINVTLYRDYWLGTAENRQRLASLEQDIEKELAELDAQDLELSQIRLKTQNRKATFLNSLIIRRTFPWSDLFDRLEEFTPDDVRLVSVNPLVKLAIEDGGSNGSTETARTPSADQREHQPGNAVSLKITGWAKSEEALATFVDTLYREPAFGPPLLQGEFLDTEGGKQAVRFNLDTSFLIDYSAGETQVVEDGSAMDEGSEDDDKVTKTEKNADPLTASQPETGDPADQNTEPNVIQADASGQPRTAPPPRTTAPNTRNAPQTSKEDEAIQQELEESRQGTPLSSPLKPQGETITQQTPRRDRQQQLEALRARALARRQTSQSPSDRPPPRRPPGTRPLTPQPSPEEEDDPTDITPPASSTPRVNGISWLPPHWDAELPGALRPGLVRNEEIRA